MMTSAMHVLIVDDDASLRRTLRTVLEAMRHVVAEAGSSSQALELATSQRLELAFLDLRLGREKGLDLLPELLRAAPGMGVVLMTAFASIDTAVEAMRRGAFDYLPKPFTPDQLRVVLNRWQLVSGLRAEVADLRSRVEEAVPETDLSTEEPAVKAALDVAFRVAPTDATVLIRGESGTGKGVVARAIHGRSPRAGRPFVTVHCPSLSAELLESELFGHAKGAFTGAIAETEGKVAAAEGGTLFLDEVADLPSAVQPKLLRFLQERTYERVGETRTRTGDVRLIAATNRDLEVEVQAGRFREDLFYRLNVIEITLPPLRARSLDIMPLADRLLRFFARQSAKTVTGFTPEARAALERHTWPGNLRELRNVVERGVILVADTEVGLADLPVQLFGPRTRKIEVGETATLDEVECEHIRRVLSTAPTLDDAATTLGIDPSTLRRKRKRYGL
jgi:NtrC-family two-component system response regulator AlgB